MSEYTVDLDDSFQIAALTAEQLSPLTSPYTSLTSGLGASGSSGHYNTAIGTSIYTTNGTGGSYIYPGSNLTTPWAINNGSTPSVKIQGDAEFEGKVMINGRNISEFMETISKRLAILQPDPKKLEHFKALQKAYDHYKLMEALCELPESNDDK